MGALLAPGCGCVGPFTVEMLGPPPGNPRGRLGQEQMEESVIHNWKRFHADESGQDLVEYTLLMAFVCLASAALFISVGRNVASIWGFANTSLSQAYSAANASS